MKLGFYRVTHTLVRLFVYDTETKAISLTNKKYRARDYEPVLNELKEQLNVDKVSAIRSNEAYDYTWDILEISYRKIHLNIIKREFALHGTNMKNTCDDTYDLIVDLDKNDTFISINGTELRTNAEKKVAMSSINKHGLRNNNDRYNLMTGGLISDIIDRYLTEKYSDFTNVDIDVSIHKYWKYVSDLIYRLHPIWWSEYDGFIKFHQQFQDKNSDFHNVILVFEMFCKSGLFVPPEYIHDEGKLSTKRINLKEKKLHKKLGIDKNTFNILKTIKDGEQLRSIIRMAGGIYTYGSKKIEFNTINNKYNIKKLSHAIHFMDKLKKLSNYQYRQVDKNKLLELYDMGYDLEKLIDYLENSLRFRQGITNPIEGLSVLYDYITMAKRVNMKYERYPKSLKLRHDVVMVVFNSHKQQIDLEDFQNAMSEYEDKNYEEDDLKIVLPKTPQDIIDEGREMNHCVGSYIDRVIDKRSVIAFIRDSKTDKRIATLEINPVSLDTVQVRAKSNNNPSIEVKAFAKNYANFLKEELINKEN